MECFALILDAALVRLAVQSLSHPTERVQVSSHMGYTGVHERRGSHHPLWKPSDRLEDPLVGCWRAPE
jgi:hypothetical protein